MDPRLVAFERLLNIMDELREKCPWDKKQTFESLRYLTIEEVYELSDAIMDGNRTEIKKELGDILLHMVFYAKLGAEENAFDITDALNGICEKLIHRHPHIYGDVTVQDEDEVKANWEKLKLKEKGGNTSVLAGVPKSLPSMVKSIRIQEKVRGVGFDWDNKAQVWAKVQEELQEFKEAETPEEAKKEFGDVLFSLVNYARFCDIDPDEALESTNRKFIKRFTALEKAVKADQKDLHQMNLDEMDVYWEKAKLQD